MPIRWARSASATASRSPASPAASTHEQLEREPSLFTIINTNSPLKLDTPMLRGIIEMSARNQVVCVTPFTLAGAMAPVTVAGAVVEQNAEALAGMAFTQLVRKGAPFIYGGFTSNVDMKSGAPAFGTPEYMKACIVGGQLARRYNVPYRTSNTCAANAVDAQAAYESVFSLWGVTMGGGNFIMHGAGWLEGGLVASFEKFVLDCDLIQMVMEFLKPLETSEDALGIEAIREVGPGGHFFGAAHTLARYETCLLRADDFRLAQQPAMARRRQAGSVAEGQQRLQAGARRISRAADGSRHPRGTRRLRRAAQARRRRPDGFLMAGIKTEIIVIGGANIDVKAKADGVLIAGSSNPGTVSIGPGGVGRNIAHNLARLGVKVGLITAIGSDSYGRDIVARARPPASTCRWQ